MSGLVTEQGPGDYKIQCFPLYSLLLATGRQNLTLDYENKRSSTYGLYLHFSQAII
jgi:hypothetical protein